MPLLFLYSREGNETMASAHGPSTKLPPAKRQYSGSQLPAFCFWFHYKGTPEIFQFPGACKMYPLTIRLIDLYAKTILFHPGNQMYISPILWYNKISKISGSKAPRACAATKYSERKREMNPIILSADGTCDLDQELKERFGVQYFPFHILLDGREYKDNVDITPPEIYQIYYQKKLLPKTSAINVEEYRSHFLPWVEKGYDVIHINLGSALSSAHQNCCLAAQELGHVHVIDSGNLSTGTGLLVVEAGKMIRQRLPAQQIADRLRSLTRTCHASFILDTLTFMHAGGRCSSVAALGANLLKLKPCIQVNNQDGSMSVGKKYRGNLDSVLVKYTKDQLAQYPDIDTELLFITHSGIDAHYIQLVRETACQLMDFKEVHVTTASCTISCHCGPNTLGVLFRTRS